MNKVDKVKPKISRYRKVKRANQTNTKQRDSRAKTNHMTTTALNVGDLNTQLKRLSG